MHTLVVVTHPSPTSLTRAAFGRVLAGLESGGHEVRVIDLDAEGFDPRLSLDEKRRHLDPPESKPDLSEHFAALRWAERLVLVYPTWFGGFPARLKGWIDRSWASGVAFELPEGATRIHPGLRNIRRIEVVTSHGGSRLLNLLQGNPGKLTTFRMLRALCHPLCRRRFTAIYDIDRVDPATVSIWLDDIEKRYAK